MSPHRKIVDRIDTDKDGYVTHAELHYWIKHRQRRYIEDNVNKHWKDYDKNQDNKIAWGEYKNTTYGYYLGNSVCEMCSTILLSHFSPFSFLHCVFTSFCLLISSLTNSFFFFQPLSL